MKPRPAFFDLDSDKARQEAFGRELDRIDAQNDVRKKAQTPPVEHRRPRSAGAVRPAKPISLKAA